MTELKIEDNPCENSKNLEVGSVVSLKSGGPYMTIVAAGKLLFECAWFSYELKVCRDSFPGSSLIQKDLEEE